ncbi:MAG TPA: LD-carboxypeptidase [Myxococcales bacterium]|nr:LD-carboxypeptidase [Myxococcales bacterium]
MVQKPPRLRPADRVSIVAPAGPFDRESFEAGFEVLARRYEPVFDPGLYTSTRYLAGDDDRRLRELESALRDDRTRAVFCARGGYGAMRLLRRLRLDDSIPLKPLIGFSDITTLHLAFLARGRATIHGPVLTQLAKQPPDSLERLYTLLESDQPAPPLPGARTCVPGRARGPLAGGNLSVLTRLLGTPFLPDLRGALLFLEDVGERPYRLDRMWTHLDLAGVFTQVSGIVLGDFTSCAEPSADYTADTVLGELARATNLPCAAGFRFGHGDVNHALPHGCLAELDANASPPTLTFLEPFAS